LRGEGISGVASSEAVFCIVITPANLKITYGDDDDHIGISARFGFDFAIAAISSRNPFG